MNRRSRSMILSKIPNVYIKNAVVFNVPKPELLRRLKKREAETGKSIPLHVVDNFIDSYEKPTNSEFFILNDTTKYPRKDSYPAYPAI